MNTSTSYTPLECLLLFQSLVAYGTEDKSFVRISDLLTNNALVKDGDTYDPGRLSSDALRDLYLKLLRAELESEEDGAEDSGQSGSKKRKLQTPTLTTIKDAQEHKEKLPILVEILYARYRDYMVKAIEDDERQYREVQREISEIEGGEWDERILREHGAAANHSGVSVEDPRPTTNGTSPHVPSQQTAPELQPPNEADAVQKPTSPIKSPRLELRPEGLAINDVLNSRESSARGSPKVDQRPQNGTASPNAQVAGSNGPHGPSPLQPPQQQSGMTYQWEPPQVGPGYQPPYPNAPPYPQYGPQQQYPPYQGPPRGSFPPHGVPPPHLQVPSSPHNGQQPILLPPPNSIRRSPSSPAMPLDALADVAGQQFRAPSGSPMQQQGPFTPGGYAQPYPTQQRPVPPNGPQWNQQYAPYQGSPQQYYAPPNQQAPFPARPDLVAPENRQYNSPYNASQGPRPPVPPVPSSQTGTPYTPMVSGLRHLITGSGTRWTPNQSPMTPRQSTNMQSPAVEPLSPVMKPKKLPSPKKSTKKSTQNPEVPKAKLGRPRGTQRTRAPSIGSSVRRSMSMSTMSHAEHPDHADELSLDNHVKQEVATPLPLGEDETGDTTADESASLPPIRRLPPSSLVTSPTTLKRKRGDSIGPPQSPSRPPTHVLWTRNFPKISASALESILGHKNASMFNHPIKERDAPGYSSIILRPQDLKSLKSAISAGNRAATAAENSSADSGTLKSENSIWLPISEDLVPPKGIINYAQLEKELMRMFANAIMFNADPDRGFGDRLNENKEKKSGEGYEIDEDGVVKDTRAMFATVEEVIGALREAEQKGAEGAQTLGVGMRGSSRGGSRGNSRGNSVIRGGSLARGTGSSVRGESVVRGSSVVNTEGGGDEDEDELAGDGGATPVAATGTKRRRKG